MDDMNVLDFYKYLKKKKNHYPISDEFYRCENQTSDVSLMNQKEHMTGWFLHQMTLGTGNYTREAINTSSKRTYNKLQCPEALLWIAEAVGVDSQLVQAAADAAAKAEGRSKQKQSGAIRSIIPWSVIFESLH